MNYQIDASWMGSSQSQKLSFFESNFSSIDSQLKQSNPLNVTYSFYNSASEVGSDYSSSRLPSGQQIKFYKIPEETRNNFRDNLQLLENAINVKFKEVESGSGQIRIGSHNTKNSISYASAPNTSPQTLWISDFHLQSLRTAGIGNDTDLLISTSYSTLWHEFGHVMGLTHPGDYPTNSSDDGLGGSLSQSKDFNLLSQMSYVMVLPQTNFFGPLDLYALRKIYGAPAEYKPLNYVISNKDSGILEKLDFSSNGNVNILISNSSFLGGYRWIFGTPGSDSLSFDITQDINYKSLYANTKIGLISEKNTLNLSPTQTLDNPYGNATIIGAESVKGGGIFVMPFDGSNFHRIELLSLSSGDDEIVLGDYFSKISSGAGNDTFTGFQSGVSIDGGAGADSLFITGNSSSYIVDGIKIKSNLDQVSATPMSISSIERIIFSDKELNTTSDLRGNPGQIYRVYKAVFNRDPMTNDMKGLGYWIKQTDNGMQLQEVAARFIDSNEFRLLYGTNPTNSEYLTKVYSNVLGRMPDKAGFDWWLSEMNTNPTKTKVKVLTDFSESPENQQGVAALIGDGIVFEPWTG